MSLLATWLEVAALSVYAVVVVFRASHADASSAMNVALLCVVLFTWAGGLALAARGLNAGRRWARAPLVVTQLLAVAVSVPLVQAGVRWIGWPLLAGSAAALVALFAPAMTRLLTQT